MQFVYRPEGLTTEQAMRWDFDPDKLMSPEAEVIERRTGMTFTQWQQKVSQGSVLALHGLLFVMLKRDRPTLKWDEVVFNLSECDFQLSDEETAQTLAALEERERADDLDPAGQSLLELLRREATEGTPVDTDAPDGEEPPPFD